MYYAFQLFPRPFSSSFLWHVFLWQASTEFVLSLRFMAAWVTTSVYIMGSSRCRRPLVVNRCYIVICKCWLINHAAFQTIIDYGRFISVVILHSVSFFLVSFSPAPVVSGRPQLSDEYKWSKLCGCAISLRQAPILCFWSHWITPLKRPIVLR